MTTINISTLNKAAVLAALFNASRQQGMGFMHTEGRVAMTNAEAEELLKEGDSFDYLRGRVMKLQIEDEMYVGLYDRDNGEGAAARALEPLFAKGGAAVTDEPYVHIPLINVDSNQVAAVGYDPESKTLAVTFKRGAGAIYHYPNVEPKLHADFIGAESIGKFFGQHIQGLPFKKFPALATKAEADAAAA